MWRGDAGIGLAGGVRWGSNDTFYHMEVQMPRQPLLGSLSFLYQFTMYKSCTSPCFHTSPLLWVSVSPFLNWTFRGQGKMISEIFSKSESQGRLLGTACVLLCDLGQGLLSLFPVSHKDNYTSCSLLIWHSWALETPRARYEFWLHHYVCPL